MRQHTFAFIVPLFRLIVLCSLLAPQAGMADVVVLDDRPAAVRVDSQVRPLHLLAGEAELRIARQLAGQLHQIAPYTGPADVSPVRLLVGREGLGLHDADRTLSVDTLHPFGYVITWLDEDHLAIVGATHAGTGYGAADFLKRFAGYRQFMPGTLGQVRPRLDAVELPAELNLIEEPDLITYANAGLWGGDGQFFRSWRTTVQATHNLSNILPPDRYAASHPEYYPLVNGRRLAPPTGPWNPCVSNPDLPGIVIEWAKGYFEEHPEHLGFSVGVNDGGGDCFCDDCVALEQQFGNRYIPFYNQVARLAAQSLPGKLVGFIAYGRAAAVPRGITLEPNLYVEVASGLRDNLEPLRQWHQAGARHLGYYGYLYGKRYIVPRHYPHTLARAWRQARQSCGLTGAWVESYIANWLYDGPRQYVINELAWDLDADVESLLTDYFTCFYQEAGEPMRRFFDRIEQIHQRKDDPLHFMADSRSRAMLAEYTHDDVVYLDEQIAHAQAIATDPQVQRRLTLFGKIFGLSRLFILADAAIRELEQAPGTSLGRDVDAVIALARQVGEWFDAIDNYTLSQEAQREIFIRDSLEEFRGRLVLRPAFDQAADQAFTRLSDQLAAAHGRAYAVAFWQRQAQQTEAGHLRGLFETQAHLLEQPGERIDIWPGEPVEQAERDAGLAPWAEVRRAFRGWATYGFPSAPADFYWDPAGGDGDAGRLVVGMTGVRGTFARSIRVVPGERYRLTFRVSQTPPGRTGQLMLRWQTGGQWLRPEPIVSLPFQTDPENGQAVVQTTFTVPPKASTALLLFGVGRQTQDQTTAFDRFELTRLYAPPSLPQGDDS